MGHNGRPWTALIPFYALAILMAALGPSDPPESPVVDAAEAHATTPSHVAPAVVVVASR